jgi:hypothetical protein
MQVQNIRYDVRLVKVVEIDVKEIFSDIPSAAQI